MGRFGPCNGDVIAPADLSTRSEAVRPSTDEFSAGAGERRERMEGAMADEPVVAQTGPYQVELTEGKAYFYCRCGRSQKQPFCDGSHTGTGIEPMRFVVDHTGTFNICGCKQTDDEPFCDGSHLLL